MTRSSRSVQARHLVVLALASLAGGCGILELGTIGVRGEVAEPAQPLDGDDWAVELVVEPGTVAGVDGDRVAVRFDADELSCVDGAALQPRDLEVGWVVNLDRDGDELVDGEEGGAAPQIRGAALAVDCPGELDPDAA